VLYPMMRETVFDQRGKCCDKLDGQNGQNGLFIKALSVSASAT
jgi:hypothetical protein